MIGISTVGAVKSGGVLKSFSDLQEEFDLHRTQFFRYLQLRHALTQYLANETELVDHNLLEAKIILSNPANHKISNIHRSIVVHSPDSFDHLRELWVADITPLENERWLDAQGSLGEAALAAQFRFIQQKYLHRIYNTRERLWRRGLIPSGTCLRCSCTNGDCYILG